MNTLNFWPHHGLTLAATDSSALITFLLYTVAVFGLAALSSRLLKSRSFLSEYFLGSRSLGVWALALTFAATMASGGSFTGFPSLIYSHGWVLALWISSYMIFPICTMGFLGKRINQVSRKTGAITVPDILRDRFNSSSFGLLATSLIVFFMCINLVGQFKAGSMILQTLLQDVSAYQSATVGTASIIRALPFLEGVEPGYLLCLLTFGVAVIIYTTWGGFHAVVWTDVMQGIVMVAGVLIMLPLALNQVGGLEHATRTMAAMVPPQSATLKVRQISDLEVIPKGTWLAMGSDSQRIFRSRSAIDFGKDITEDEQALLDKHKTTAHPGTRVVEAIEIVDEYDLNRIRTEQVSVQISTDAAIEEILQSEPAAFPGESNRAGSFVTAPGPHPSLESGMLPLSLAFSFFFMWAISGTGQPHSMVRLMAFRSTKTLRMSIVTVVIYYSFIYFPLVIIFCCSRLLLPGMEVESDRVMPQVAVTLTNNVGVGWLAGVLVAAPFAAVMSTVDSFLLMISSSVVRDIYQRNINPNASEGQLKRLSYLCTLAVGVVVVIAAMNPPEFLQYIIIYVGSGLAACFLAPIVLALYWPRATTRGAMSSMLAGFLSHLSLYVLGWVLGGDFSKPYRPLELDPVVVGIVLSFVVGFAVSLTDSKPDADLVRRYFFSRKDA
jgi:Na+/pantothenate symporter